jgi:hypothetical protein
MAAEPFDWNVVVAGYWNPAILTPSWIARRLFELDEGTPIAVEVPMDGFAPHRVRHKGIIVTAETGRLVLMLEVPNLKNLEHARQIAIRAMEKLPETPLTAGGFNIRFKLDDPPEKLLKATTADVDKLLSDADFAIKTMSIRRSIEYGQGFLNLDISQKDGADTKMEFNFHRQSSVIAELRQWFETPCDDVKTVCTTILEKIAGLEFGEEWQ